MDQASHLCLSTPLNLPLVILSHLHSLERRTDFEQYSSRNVRQLYRARPGLSNHNRLP